MRLQITPLEERIVLDADALNQVQNEQVYDPEHLEDALLEAESSAFLHTQDFDSEILSSENLNIELEKGLSQLSSLESETLRVLVVSSNVENSQNILDSAQAGVLLVHYDYENTSLEELNESIALALDGKLADSIAFVQHGDE